MKFEDKMAARKACVQGVPFFCGGHTIVPVPFDEISGECCCIQCEMGSECKGDIFEMCEFVNTFHGYDEFCFKFNEKEKESDERSM